MIITDFKKAKQLLRLAYTDWKRANNFDPKITYFISFPKCGMTWLRLMLCQILINHYNLPENKPTVLLNELTSKYPILPRIVQTHEDSALINEKGDRNNAEKLFQYAGRFSYRRNKVLLLVRDPRDVVISHYYQVTKRTDKPLEVSSLSEFIRHPIYGFQRIIRFYKIWNWNHWLIKDFLIIKYEDLMNDGLDTLTKILDFLGITGIDTELIEQIYQLNQSENMRKLEKQNQVVGMRVFGSDNNSLKVRKAQVGSHQDELSDDDLQYCNYLMKYCPKIYGYS